MKRRRERTDKGGSSTGSFDSRGRVSSLFFSLFSLSSLYFVMEEEVNDDVVWKEQTSGSLTRSKARVLPFFFDFFFREQRTTCTGSIIAHSKTHIILGNTRVQ